MSTVSVETRFDPAEMPKRLERFLRDRLGEGSSVEVLEFTPMTGGYSRLMASFTAIVDGAKQRLVARGDPAPGVAVIETDRRREYALLERLTADGTVPMPAARFFDADGSVLGTPTILVDYVDGPSLLSRVRSGTEAEYPGHAAALCDLAAKIHSVDLSVLPEELERPDSWDGYIDALLAQWRAAEAEHGESDPFFRYMAAWLDQNRPEPAPLGLLHGELQPGNIVVGSDGLKAVDWELARIGDPREDLGWCQWVGSVQPPDLIGLDSAEFCRRYRERTGLGEDVVNPMSLAYFSILPAIRVFRGINAQVDAFASGANTAVKTAYMTCVLTTAHEGWVNAAAQIEAVGGTRGKGAA
jgi:aminoglycoside phosphotransferase (APT) family kinase protein